MLTAEWWGYHLQAVGLRTLGCGENSVLGLHTACNGMFTGTSDGEGWKLVSEEQRVGKEKGERDERLQEAESTAILWDSPHTAGNKRPVPHI